MRTARTTSAIVLLVAALGACSGDDASSSGGDAAATSDGAGADGGAQVDGAVADGAGNADARGDSSVAVDSGGDGGRVTYSTNFDVAESPISENGAWSHVGLDWAHAVTSGGIAYGTQTGSGGYDDSYAHLSGFGADQTASAVIHRAANIDGSCTHEVEIHLRWSDAAHDAHGYEFNLAFDGSYSQIVRWNGAFGSFMYLAYGSVPGGVHDGDVIAASAIGNALTLTVNGAVVASATDSTWTTGNPGMGFWRGGTCGNNADYGFTSYTASSPP